MNNAQAEPLPASQAVFIFARLQQPIGPHEATIRAAIYRALPQLRHTYRTYTYAPSRLMVQDGRIIPTPDPAHNIHLLPDPDAPAELAEFVTYCLSHVPHFAEPIAVRYTPSGNFHLCFSHALVDGLEMIGFMEALADEFTAVGHPLAIIPPLTINPPGEYAYFHEFYELKEANPVSLYQRTVYELGERWGARSINQLVAGDVPERKVSLATVRHRSDWPRFWADNQAAIGRGKRWENRFGWWSWWVARGYRWPFGLYDGLVRLGRWGDWARPWTMGDLQVSAMRLREPCFLMFPVRHPMQGRAVVLGAVGEGEGRPWVQLSGVVRKKS